MCFGKKEKPQPGASPQEKSGPRRARSPPQASLPRASDQRPASRRRSRYNYPATQGQDHMDPLLTPPVNAAEQGSQPPRESRPHRALNLDQVKPRTSDWQRTNRRRSWLDYTPLSDGEIIIAVMGVTGAGKSYFIREVTGNLEVKVSSGLYSCTSKIQPYSFKYAGAKITLIDTPGFDDTERSDTEVLQEIVDWTSATYKKNQLLSGIIYLHPITHTRMEGSAMRNLGMFQSLCGEEALKNVLLTTTQWSNVDPVEGQTRENNLQDEGLWGGLIRKGATLQRFRGTKESGLELIHKLISNTPKSLHIQDQIVKQDMTLLETDAGKFLNEGLAAQEKGFGSLEKQHQESTKAKDDEMNEISAAKQASDREKLGGPEAEQIWLEGLHAAEIEKRKVKGRKGQGGIEGHDRDTRAGPSRPRRTQSERPVTMFVQDSRPA